jgi:HEAT repeat protein
MGIDPQSPAASPTPQRRSKRLYILWAVALTLLISTALFCWLVVVPVWQVRKALSRCHRQYPPDVVKDSHEDVIRDLGGKHAAANKIRLYLRMPAFLTEGRPVAVVLLGNCGDNALPTLLDIYHSDDDSLKVAALYAMTTFADDRVVQPLTEALGSEFPALRKAASRRLAGDKRATKALAVLLQPPRANPNAWVKVSIRLEAVEGLLRIRDRRVVRPLVGALSDPDARVAEAAEKALKSVLGPKLGVAVDAFAHPTKARHMISIPSIQPKDPRVPEFFLIYLEKAAHESLQFEAILGLELIGDRRTVPALIEKLSSNCKDVRCAAIGALGAMGDSRALPPLEKLLADENKEVRQAAAEALKKIKAAQEKK